MKSVVAVLFCLFATGAAAFPAFTYGDGQAVPVDFEEVSLGWTFDAQAKTATAVATVIFFQEAEGYPVFDLIPTPTDQTIDGETVSTPTVSPGGATTARVVAKKLAAGLHRLGLKYNIASEVTFGSGTVRLGTFMGDLSDRQFFEQYAPTNFEFDQYAQTLAVSVVGTATEHTVYTNGNPVDVAANEWSVTFPAYFTTSSFYFHVAPKGHFNEQRFDLTLQSGRSIPAVVYGSSSSSVSSGVSRSRSVIAELESTYGDFAHDRLVVFLAGSGGMEYCGATMTDLGALGHELTHSYFARGVMPADGNAGWIDEAIASWRDNGYPRGSGSPAAANLGGFSPYKRATTQAAYTTGMRLISVFDGRFSGQGGMRALLKAFFAKYKRTTVTNETLRAFLAEATGDTGLDAVFKRSVYGQNFVGPTEVAIPIGHPRPYTKAEYRALQ